MRKQNIILHIEKLDKNILLADGFDEAVIGVTYRENELVALYSTEKIIQMLIDKQNMTYDCAVEYFEYNIAGSYMGKKTPVYYNFNFDEEET